MISPLGMVTRTRKVYLQCESALSSEQQENIRNCDDGRTISNIEFHRGKRIQSRGKTSLTHPTVGNCLSEGSGLLCESVMQLECIACLSIEEDSSLNIFLDMSSTDNYILV